MKKNKEYDCLRGCEKEINNDGETTYTYNRRCCKLSVFNWLSGVTQDDIKDFFEVRFKNTRKIIYKNDSGRNLKIGDVVVVEAQNGCDVGLITLAGPIIVNQLQRDRIDPKTYEFKKIYRKARPNDIEKWQEAVAREHKTMIRSRQMASDLQLNMKIGDVEFQGDGSKAIFYYIADERVDFRQLIKNFAEEFRIRIEMKQIGARQEAGLIGGLGVCGQALCCSRYMSDFQSITTQAARCQDLSLNPQKLAGQCGKLKCCINYEASTYIDAQSSIPKITEPLQFEDGEAHLMKTDILRGIMWFSYDPHSMANMKLLTAKEVKEIILLNKKGIKSPSLFEEALNKSPEFLSAVGEDSISRFDVEKNKKRTNTNR
ncbi:MAG: regulatory iron-sulfur-containing complex subunit RicT, partial [Bacteroidales bacterium]